MNLTLKRKVRLTIDLDRFRHFLVLLLLSKISFGL